MKTFVLATANAHKTEEMRAALAGCGVELLERPREIPDVDESKDTLEGNAALKARAVSDATGLPAVADDTGLFVDALGGRPGVRSSRYAGNGASYEDNVRLLLEELRDVEESERTAHFRTVIAVAKPDGSSWLVEGVLHGTILHEPRGQGGFGYDPVFVPRGEKWSLAEMTAAQKNAISHRGRALRAFAERLQRE